MHQVRGLGMLALLLLAAVAAPTACVLWFLNAAVENERLAVRQKLEKAYRPHLAGASRRLESYWQNRARQVRSQSAGLSPAGAFSGLVRSGTCDSALIYGTSGELLYPAPPADRGLELEDAGGLRSLARANEFEGKDPAAAASLYAQMAEQLQDVDASGVALLSQARCLAAAGLQQEALGILTGPLSGKSYSQARDEHGRLVSVSARLRALELVKSPRDPQFEPLLNDLARRLRTYEPPPMSPAQRRFAMRRLLELAPDPPEFPTLRAEHLAARYLQTDPAPPSGDGLRACGLSEVWCFSPPDSGVVALLKEESFSGALLETARAPSVAGEVSLGVRPPGRESPDRSPFLEVPAAPLMPGWSVALYLEGEDPFAAAAERQVASYVWAGILSIGSILIAGLLVGGYLLRQMRLTRLKNDFIATVSHELKTPLSSVRVLVDTLREGRCRDEGQQQEYLDMVARENERLSHLIDNFLSFSRMERDKQSLDFQRVEPREVVETAAEVVRARFSPPPNCFKVEQEDALPPIHADRGALVTVLLNLLDNAFKYSDGDGQVTLRSYRAEGDVCLQVQDDGMGMSRRDIRKAFDRFYQADRRLSRESGGCGLGLSIVKFIVDAHQGTIEVDSEPGEGSTFTIRLPLEQGAPHA